MNDNSHEPDRGRRSFLFTSLFGGFSLLVFLFMALMNWIIKQTEELRRKQRQDRYKASPIYPYKKDWRLLQKLFFYLSRNLDQRYILPIEQSVNQLRCQSKTVKLSGRNHPEWVDRMEQNIHYEGWIGRIGNGSGWGWIKFPSLISSQETYRIKAKTPFPYLVWPLIFCGSLAHKNLSPQWLVNHLSFNALCK